MRERIGHMREVIRQRIGRIYPADLRERYGRKGKVKGKK